MRKFVISALLLSLLIGQGKAVTPKKAKKTNVIIILADDLGFSDLGCYGSEIRTPNLDYLASQGIRFSQFYNTSRCCPSRAALLTGQYNHQAGIGEMTTDMHLDGYRGYITDRTVTLAEVARSAGYNTAMVGKWHVSNTIEQADPAAQLRWLEHQEEHPLFSPLEQYPINKGFDRFYGTLWGVVDFFDPFSLVNGSEPVKNVPAGYYHTDALNDTASAYIRRMSQDHKPFFLYVAQNAPHWPLHALPEDIARYREVYKVGWEAIRESRYKQMARLGILDTTTCKLSPRLNSELTWEANPDKEYDAMAMAVHAAMIDRMDQGIGRIIKALKETGQLENTLILFLSDNGASPEVCASYGPGFDRPGETRKGEKIDYSLTRKVMPGPETVYGSIGPRWANVANTPFKLAKAESYEGGIHTPCIVFWPKGLKLEKGSIQTHVGHIIDIMPTLVDLMGAVYPETYKGHTIGPMQGISFLPVLEKKKELTHDWLFNEHYGARYVRYLDWKLVSTSRDSVWKLYDLRVDKSEMNDLAASYPDRVLQMSQKWQEWADRNKVFPKPVVMKKNK